MEFYGAEAHCIPYEEVTTSPPKFQEMLSITAYREKVHGEPWPTQIAALFQVKRDWPIPMPERRLEAPSICSTADIFYTRTSVHHIFGECWPPRGMKWEAYLALQSGLLRGYTRIIF